MMDQTPENRNSEFDLSINFDHGTPLSTMVEETLSESEKQTSLSGQELIKNAKILLSSGDTKLARKIFTALIERGEFLGVSYSGLGACFELEGKDDMAIKAYREAIIYEPSFGTLSAMSEIYIKKNDFQNAISTLLRAGNLPKVTSQQEFEVHKCLGNCYLHIEQLNNAEAHYRRAYDLNALSDQLHVNIGSLALKKLDSATALLHFKEASRINAKNSQAYLGMGLAYLSQGSKKLAHDSFYQSLKLNIKEMSALLNLVKCAYELKQYEQAGEILREYVCNNTVNGNILFSYAGILYHLGKFAEARDECEKLCQLNPQHEGAKKLKELLDKKLG